MKPKQICILLIDDNPDILELLRYHLSCEGYKVYTAENGFKGVDLAKEKKPNLIILDVVLNELDGFETCKLIRKIPELCNSIITFLTARSGEYCLMAGLEAGADDYITKPIKPKMLLSKIKALLRRFKENEPYKNILEIGNLVINREKYLITKDNLEFNLPRKEFELLSLLASKPGKIFQRKEIIDKIWGEVVEGSGTLEVHIKKLRNKVGVGKIVTVRGLGYKIVP